MQDRVRIKVTEQGPKELGGKGVKPTGQLESSATISLGSSENWTRLQGEQHGTPAKGTGWLPAFLGRFDMSLKSSPGPSPAPGPQQAHLSLPGDFFAAMLKLQPPTSSPSDLQTGHLSPREES